MLLIFIAWIIFICLEQKANFNFIKGLWNKGFCCIVMPSENSSENNHGLSNTENLINTIFYLNKSENFMKVTDGFKNNFSKIIHNRRR